MERKQASKQIDFEIKNLSVTKDGSGTLYIEGYANTVSKDRVGDVVLPKAFAKSLPTYQDNPVLLFQHNWDTIIGSVPVIKIDEHGLWIRGRISDAKDCDDVRTKIREGTLRTLSIGYNELESDYDESTKTKIVKELELLEISVVTIPANTEAKFRPVEQVDNGKAFTVILSDRVAKLIKDEKALPAVAAFLNNMSKGEIMENQPTDKNAGAAGAAGAVDQNPEAGKKLDEVHAEVKALHETCKGMADQCKAMHDEIKAMHDEMKNKPNDQYQYPAPKSLEQMSEQELDAALATETAELERLTDGV